VAARVLAGGLLLWAAAGGPGAAWATPSQAVPSGGWILTAQEAARRLRQGALLLDAREPQRAPAQRLRGAVPVAWRTFAAKSPASAGRLLEDNEPLQGWLRALGVDGERSVVVVGDPARGWGEEGRIVWMLRTLGHPSAAFVDGGQRALVKAGWPREESGAARGQPARGSFVVLRQGRWTRTTEEIAGLLAANRLGPGGVALVDVREPREFAGETPYGERRGGHVPGAVALHYRELLAADGRLLPRAAVLARLAALGIAPKRPTVTTCTGGVRSAWLVAVLVELGFGDVRNHPGSMWHWSAQPAATHPLKR